MKKKAVIYTAIAGNYDDLIEHRYVSPYFQYVCFSDAAPRTSNLWQIKPMTKRQFDFNRKAKYYKFFPHELFPDFAFSIWIDANIDILDDTLERRILELIDLNVPISANKHFARNCLYAEAMECLKVGKGNSVEILKQIDNYRSSGFPMNAGLFEMNIIFRNHRNPEVKKVMRNWWHEVQQHSNRDQISFPYVLTRGKMTCEQMFPMNSRSLPGFRYHEHVSYVKMFLYLDTGDGFTESAYIAQQVKVDGSGYFSVEFSFLHFPKIFSMKFTPTASDPCKCRGLMAQASHKNWRFIYDNRSTQDQDWDVFYTPNPMYVIAGDFSDSMSVTISGQIQILHMERTLRDIFEGYVFTRRYPWEKARRLVRNLYRRSVRRKYERNLISTNERQNNL